MSGNLIVIFKNSTGNTLRKLICAPFTIDTRCPKLLPSGTISTIMDWELPLKPWLCVSKKGTTYAKLISNCLVFVDTVNLASDVNERLNERLLSTS